MIRLTVSHTLLFDLPFLYTMRFIYHKSFKVFLEERALKYVSQLEVSA